MSEPGDNQPILSVVFYASVSGQEPVRVWLQALSRDDRRAVGFDIKTAQYGWPVGMPLIHKVEPGLWEVRTPAPDLRIARQRLADLRKE